jgi:hypothetical protein
MNKFDEKSNSYRFMPQIPSNRAKNPALVFPADLFNVLILLIKEVPAPGVCVNHVFKIVFRKVRGIKALFGNNLSAGFFIKEI